MRNNLRQKFPLSLNYYLHNLLRIICTIFGINGLLLDRPLIEVAFSYQI